MKKFFYQLIVLSTVLFSIGAEAAQQIEFLTYNVCYSRRAVNEYAAYSWESRRDEVYKLIQGVNPNIIFLQEILTKNMDEIPARLSDYQWHFETTNTRDGICCNGIGVKKTFMSGVEQHKFTYNFNRFEKTAEKVLGLVIGDLCLVNMHFPMEEKGRLSMAANLDQCLPANKGYRVIIAGDFNAFPAYKGAEQLDTIQKVTNTARISDLAISEITGQIATRSFIPYPYDFVPEEALKMPGKLDHIFVRGLKIADGTTPVVLDAALVEGKEFAPSDHFPLMCELVFE